MQIVVVDVGNSSIKYRVIPDWPTEMPRGEPPRTRSLAVEPHADWPGLPLTNRAHWFVSSVNRDHLARLSGQAHAQDRVVQWHEITHADVPLQINVSQPASVGIDRLLAALAAKRTYGAGREVVVIDCGTALTIDLVDQHDVFQGGVILAGPEASLRALSLLTSALPDLSKCSIERPHQALGKSTSEAMLRGAYYYGLGAIREVVAAIERELGAPPQVIGTGGGLGMWSDVLPDDWMLVDNLVLDGILMIAASMLSTAQPDRHLDK